MKKPAILFIFLCFSVLFFSCKTDTENSKPACNEKKSEKNKDSIKMNANTLVDEFEIFWVQFQKVIDKNDKQAFIDICGTDDVKNFFTGNYDNFITDEMREAIKSTKASDIEDFEDGSKAFYLKESYPSDPETGETFESSTGFIFKKINGKWAVYQPHMAG